MDILHMAETSRRQAPDFIHSSACKSRVHCVECLMNPGWRKQVGAPDVCPWLSEKEQAEARYQRTHPEPMRNTLKTCCGSALNDL